MRELHDWLPADDSEIESGGPAAIEPVDGDADAERTPTPTGRAGTGTRTVRGSTPRWTGSSSGWCGRVNSNPCVELNPGELDQSSGRG